MDPLALELTRVLPAERPAMFAAFGDPDALARWWGPAGFSVRAPAFEPVVGAAYRIEMQPPEGDAFHVADEFREVDPPERLAFTFAELHRDGWTQSFDKLERVLSGP